MFLFFREKYVEAYIDHVLNKSVGKQFRAFSEGFLRVCGGRVLVSFNALIVLRLHVPFTFTFAYRPLLKAKYG